ncbi:MAG: hypothetical protein AAFX80_22220 [Cyanobacteria bacterium J06639_18]
MYVLRTRLREHKNSGIASLRQRLPANPALRSGRNDKSMHCGHAKKTVA